MVTGATHGIGRTIAIRLAQAGFHVVLSGRDTTRGATVCHEIKSFGGSAMFISGNLIESDFAAKLFDSAEQTFGEPVTVLINNAACYPKCTTAALDETIFMQTLSLNTMVPFFLIREMAARLRAGQEATVINIGSTAATQPLGRSHHYVASKAGLLGLTRSLALEFAPAIRVNAVSPGFVATENHRSCCADRISQTPLKRLIEPAEVAEAVLFLVHQRGITGTNLIVDGGWSLNHE